MKKITLFALLALAISCKTPPKEESTEPAVSVTLPYTASYSSQFTDAISDQDLLTVLNSYKAWENGDMEGLRATMGDSLTFVRWDGKLITGPTAETLGLWSSFRDSLSSVKIQMDAWTKNHSVDKNEDVITVWYKEVDTYKTGKVDSADWHDINVVANGKIVWYAQYRRPYQKN
jgi:ketosteroid isomerase-like protein